MPAEVAASTLSYAEMCLREGAGLRRGMHFRLRGGHSVLLMSQRGEAPYHDALSEEGVLHYEGHDAPRRAGVQDPKQVDQPALTPGGALTQNGLFLEAARGYERGERPAEEVHVYEKLRAGAWLDHGRFELVGAERQHDGQRFVFVFELRRLMSPSGR